MKSSHLTEWFDDDSFWRSFYPVLISRTEVRRRTRGSCAGRRAGKACWHGRARLVLRPRQDRGSATQSGLTVTGVDRSKSFLAKARRRAEAANVNVEWVQSDMRDFVRADSFDLALSMFTSLGYFDNKEEDLDVLRNVLASLKPRGAVLIELLGKETLARIYRPVTLDIADDGTRFVQRHEIFDDWTRIRNEWILIRHGRATTFTFHHTIYSGQELRNLMERVGFVEVRLYGNLQGASYDQKAERLIAVERRKA